MLTSESGALRAGGVSLLYIYIYIIMDGYLWNRYIIEHIDSVLKSIGRRYLVIDFGGVF